MPTPWRPEEPVVFKLMLPVSSSALTSSSHDWVEDASVPANAVFEPHKLHVTNSKNNDLLCSTARIFHTHTTTKPVLALYDPGFSGEVMMSSKLARPLQPVNQDIILADGTLVKCKGIVRSAKFSPVNGFVESCDVLVFLLSMYHIIVGMAWLKAHNARILCQFGIIEFFPPHSTACEVINDVCKFTVCCSSAQHQDLSCLSTEGKSVLNVASCNQFKNFIGDDAEVDSAENLLHG